jgi:hypothetical protein
VNIGERSKAARMISCVRSLVWVMWQGSWRGCSLARPRNENTGSGVSLCCSPALSSRCAAVDARRRPGLEAAGARRDLAQPLRQRSEGGSPARRPA